MAIIEGTEFNNQLFARSTGEEVRGGDGNDTLDASVGLGNNTLRGGSGDDELFAGTQDSLLGGVGDDTLDARSGTGTNRLEGGAGNDLLFAATNDTLVGGTGNDRLFAGRENAVLKGGTGSDQFWIVQTKLPTQPNIINRFIQGVDQIGIGGLEDITFESLTFQQRDGNTVIIATVGQQMVELAIVRNFPPPDQPELALRAEDFIFADSPALAVPAPTVEDATFSVDENSLEGTIVDTVVATDIEITDDSEDSDRLTYEIISGNPDPDVDGTSAFSIDAETGAITVTDSGDLDFESSPNTFTLTVRVTDLEGLTDSATVTINLTDVNEAPTAEDATFDLVENSAVGTEVGTVIATDPNGDDLTYGITGGNTDVNGNETAAFAIDPATGAIIVADSGDLDFETTPSFDLTVEVTDSGDLTDESTVAINLTDINQENVAPVEGLQREDFMLVAPQGLQFTNVSVTDDFNGDGTPDDLNDPTSLGFAFLNGFLNYTIELEPGRRELDISIILPPNTDFNTYYKFGSTPDNPTPRLYEFTYDGQTGAEFFNLEDGTTLVVLHFIDGQRGDNDLTVNGVIVDPGAPGVGANLPAPSLEREGESFTIDGTNELVVPLNFTLTENESAFVNEIGVFLDFSPV